MEILEKWWGEGGEGFVSAQLVVFACRNSPDDGAQARNGLGKVGWVEE
jgi:hypothetical protein